jgi:hypothetical protein
MFAIVPAELADPGVLDRIRHRTRLRRFGTAWIKLEAEPIQNAAAERDLFELVLPVIDERHGRIRVVSEDDDARLAVWIDRDDTWSSLAVPIQLADRDGHAAARVGVWLTLGAPVEITQRGTKRDAIQVHDDAVRIEGWVPVDALTHVWLAARDDRSSTDHKRHGSRYATDPAQPGRPATIATQTSIRSAPDAEAPVLATITGEDLRVGIVGGSGAFREIELVRRHARIHGFVARGALTEVPESLFGHGSGTGSGFGMSHADRIEVPAGTCLFDAIEGEVTGVQLQHSIRLGRSHTDKPEWSLVYVGNAWATAALYVRNTSEDPKQPSWESCTQPAHPG